MEELRRFFRRVFPEGDVWDVAASIVAAEEMARVQARKVADYLAESLRKITFSFEAPRPYPDKIDYSDFPVSGKTTVIDVDGSGLLEELQLIATSRNFGCDIYVAGRVIHEGSFEKYLEITQASREVSAVEFVEEGICSLSFRGIPFVYGLKCDVYSTSGTITFKRVYGRWYVLKFEKELVKLPNVQKVLERLEIPKILKK